MIASRRFPMSRFQPGIAARHTSGPVTAERPLATLSLDAVFHDAPETCFDLWPSGNFSETWRVPPSREILFPRQLRRGKEPRSIQLQAEHALHVLVAINLQTCRSNQLNS